MTKNTIEYGKDFVRAIITNSSEYDDKVEYGWRKTAVNWHLANGTIYRAKGAKVFEKAKKFLETLNF